MPLVLATRNRALDSRIDEYHDILTIPPSYGSRRCDQTRFTSVLSSGCLPMLSTDASVLLHNLIDVC